MKKLNVLVYDKISKEVEKFLKESYDVTIFRCSKDYIPSDIDLILFHGEQKGDIHPERYSEVVGKFTDVKESYWSRYSSLSDYAYNGTPLLGIEDGAQYLAVNAGSSLVQHVLGHDKPHRMSVVGSSYTFTTPSKHHQMIFPYDLPVSKYKVLGWSTYFESPTYLNGKNEERELGKEFLEPEIVYFTNRSTKSLCIQGNPGEGDNTYKKHCINLIEKLLTGKL